MQKLTNYIFNLSPRKIAIYLLIGSLIFALAHTIVTVSIRNISETTEISTELTASILVLVFLFLALLVLLYLFWLRSVVYAVKESDLGIPKRWFNIAFILFIVYLLYNLCYLGIDYVPETYRDIFYMLNEFIAFGGVLIAYPTVCHYAARAVTVKRGGKPATFVNAIPFSLLLIFGAVLGIPFMHKYFSTKASTNNQVLIVYALAFGLCILLFILGFIAAITGLI